jgi:phosphoacetylglucosamine mutase
VCLGRDTREHSAKLAGLAAQGAALAGAHVHDLGLLTTPQLHHVVKHVNLRDGALGPEPEPGPGAALERTNAAAWASEAG